MIGLIALTFSTVISAWRSKLALVFFPLVFTSSVLEYGFVGGERRDSSGMGSAKPKGYHEEGTFRPLRAGMANKGRTGGKAWQTEL